MEQKPRTYVIKFGLHPPVVHCEEVLQQIEAGHRYRNAMTKIERDHIQLIREAEAEFGVDVLESQKEKVWEASKEAKGTKKKRLTTEASDLRSRIWEIRNSLPFLKRMHEIDGRKMEPKEPLKKGEKRKKKSAAESRNETRTPNDSIDAKSRRAARRAAVSNDSLFWGTYLIVERAMMASKVDCESEDGPKFVRWDGSGHIGTQIQSGKGKKPLKGRDLFGDDPRCSISCRPDSWRNVDSSKSFAMEIRRHTLCTGSKAERRQAGRVRLRMRIGDKPRTDTVTTKVPMVAEWPMIMHRDIPDDADVTWVTVTRRRVGPDFVWSCEITLREIVPVEQDQPRGVAAVVFGWRKRGKRVRVVEWMSTSGEVGVLDLLDLPIEKDRQLGLTAKDMRRSNLNKKDEDGGRGGVIDGIRLVGHLERIRDGNFNYAREELAQWMEHQRDIPDWMAKRTTKKHDRLPSKKQAVAYIRQWEAQGKLASLIFAWRDNRIDGDGAIFEHMETWRYNDYHLWEWERRQDISSRRRRKDVYRNFAAKLADQFGMLLVDGTNFKELKEKEGEKLPGRKPASMSQMVSPGEFREIIAQASTRRGRVYEKASAAKTAQRCPKCGATHRAHRDASDGTFGCSKCTYEGDVMQTRLLNMLSLNGHESAVQDIIVRMEMAKKKLGLGLGTEEEE